jgi:hypothetical protein
MTPDENVEMRDAKAAVQVPGKEVQLEQRCREATL